MDLACNMLVRLDMFLMWLQHASGATCHPGMQRNEPPRHKALVNISLHSLLSMIGQGMLLLALFKQVGWLREGKVKGVPSMIVGLGAGLACSRTYAKRRFVTEQANSDENATLQPCFNRRNCCVRVRRQSFRALLAVDGLAARL